VRAVAALNANPPGGLSPAATLAIPTNPRNDHVISPRIDRLLDHVDSNYASVIVAAKRARQINSYYHNLGEGTFDEFPPPMVDTASKNYLTIALEEVAAGKLKYEYR
jgi:DNA-directed RNA polymerase subunit omega